MQIASCIRIPCVFGPSSSLGVELTLVNLAVDERDSHSQVEMRLFACCVALRLTGLFSRWVSSCNLVCGLEP